MTINGKEYTLPELDYNAVCELDKYGVNLLGGDNIAPLVLLRGFLALCTKNKLAAGEELQAHIVEQGADSLTEAVEEISLRIEESRFFTAMRRKAEKEQEKQAKRAKAAQSLPKPGEAP